MQPNEVRWPRNGRAKASLDYELGVGQRVFVVNPCFDTKALMRGSERDALTTLVNRLITLSVHYGAIMWLGIAS